MTASGAPIAAEAVDAATLDRTIDRLAGRLLARRTAAGHWEGRLSSSALSTATAVIALALAGDRAIRSVRPDALAGMEAGPSGPATLVRGGLTWLVAKQNADGGWGDTPESPSNLSTTALCWAALAFERRPDAALQAAVERAEVWLGARAGTLEPVALKQAIVARYGRDKTFSVPILTVLALAGKLGRGPAAWRLVPQLPFELAACPHRWFQWLRLPVVSYALPALVAMGQVRHHRAPSRNPAAAAIRSRLRGRTLDVARRMQPESGGYLEAVPLTAFVVMSLISAGSERDASVVNGVRFLSGSVRPDGSWPIDTNLATWVTTLSVDALSSSAVPGLESHGAPGLQPRGGLDARAILDWLLAQQASEEHPFTHARPGGWAWTHLSGGVPDADDTAGALRALRTLTTGPDGSSRAGPAEARAAAAGIGWLLDLQNRDGGIPTFCRGWGALPFDRSAPDLTAHAMLAWDAWRGDASPDLRQRMEKAADRAVAYLARQQSSDGSWMPLWFGNQHTADERNPTFGTAHVIGALGTPLARRSPAAARSRQRGIDWLLAAQNADGGWGGGPGAPSTIEETGLALHALASDAEPSIVAAMARGARWLVDATEEGQRTPASPIGLYFARLWYDEELYPLIFALKGLSAASVALVEPRDA